MKSCLGAQSHEYGCVMESIFPYLQCLTFVAGADPTPCSDKKVRDQIRINIETTAGLRVQEDAALWLALAHASIFIWDVNADHQMIEQAIPYANDLERRWGPEIALNFVERLLRNLNSEALTQAYRADFEAIARDLAFKAGEREVAVRHGLANLRITDRLGAELVYQAYHRTTLARIYQSFEGAQPSPSSSDYARTYGAMAVAMYKESAAIRQQIYSLAKSQNRAED
jgi:hypothetical protein